MSVLVPTTRARKCKWSVQTAPLFLQGGTCIERWNDLPIAYEKDGGTAGPECFDWAAAGHTPRPCADGEAEKPEVVKEMAGDPDVPTIPIGAASNAGTCRMGSGPQSRGHVQRSPFLRIGASIIIPANDSQ
jgi:hypothetical protein